METYIKYPNGAGIYKLTCKVNNKVYIGKSVTINRRLNRHKNCKTPKDNFYLHNAIIKHGWDSFTVEILELFENFDRIKDNDTLLEREAFYIKLYDSTNKLKGYNRCEYSTDCTGRKLTEEHKEKLRQCNLGKKMSKDAIERTRQAKLGKPRSEETKEKIRQKKLGVKLSEEHKEKLRNRKLSEEHKEKIGNSGRGKKRSEEFKEKMRQINLGRKHSEETKEKIRQFNLRKSQNNQSDEEINR